MNNVANWLTANKLTLNIDKIKDILYNSNRKTLSNCSQTIYLYNTPLKQLSDIFLRVHLNEGFS